MSPPPSLPGPTPPPARWGFASAARARNALRPAATVLGSVAADAQRSRLPQMAAALAYRTIFGMIPVMVVALVGLKFFTTEADIQRTLQRTLAYAGLSGIDIDPAAAAVPPEALTKTWLISMGTSPVPRVVVPKNAPIGAVPLDKPAPDAKPDDAAPVPNPTPAPSPDASADDATPAAPGTVTVESTGSPKLDQWITQLVGRVSTIPFRTIGVIGLIALLYAAISMLVEIERAFNQIYRVPVGRSWARRVTNYWSLLTLGVLMLFATFYVGEQFANWASNVAQSRGLIQGSETRSVRAIGFAVLVLISTSFLLLAYTSVPNTRVRLRPALAGAFLAAVLWELGKWGFTAYVRDSAGYARMYGSLAILPLFLLWVYVTWVIVLLGLQVSYYLQFEQYKKAPPPPPPPPLPKLPPVLDPAASLAVVAAIARAFQEGRAVPVAALHTAVRAGSGSDGVVRAILERLVARNIVHAVEKSPGEAAAAGDRFTLSRPAEAIPMGEVLDAGYELVDASDVDGSVTMGSAAAGATREGAAGDADPIVDRLRRAQRDEVRGMTVAALVGGGGPAPGTKAAPAKAPTEPKLNGARTGEGLNGAADCSKPGGSATLPPAG